MSDWQKGDLALCIESGTVTRKGLVYTISELCPCGEGFQCIEAPSTVDACCGFRRFRKIRPSAIKHIEALKEIPAPVRENEHA